MLKNAKYVMDEYLNKVAALGWFVQIVVSKSAINAENNGLLDITTAKRVVGLNFHGIFLPNAAPHPPALEKKTVK
jgi:hypothetical protein